LFDRSRMRLAGGKANRPTSKSPNMIGRDGKCIRPFSPRAQQRERLSSRDEAEIPRAQMRAMYSAAVYTKFSENLAPELLTISD
jgi:hypothetical protein